MLASAIRDAAANRFSDASFVIYSSAEWLEYVNDRYTEVWGASPFWPFKRTHLTTTVTAGQRASASLGSGSFRVESVLDSTNDNRMLPLGGRADIAKNDPTEDATGPPRFYRLYNNKIEVYPLPTATVTLKVDCLIASTDLAAGDTPGFPEQYHRMLVDGALATAYADDGNGAMAKFYEDRFVKKLEQMKGDLLDTQEEGSHVIVDDYWTG